MNDECKQTMMLFYIEVVVFINLLNIVVDLRKNLKVGGSMLSCGFEYCFIQLVCGMLGLKVWDKRLESWVRIGLYRVVLVIFSIFNFVLSY